MFPLKFSLDLSRFFMKPKRIQSHSLPRDVGCLPEDLVVSILSGLPVKSLCRFKCVSKPWLSLISDRQFAKIHEQCQVPKPIISSYEQNLSAVYAINSESPFDLQPKLTSPWRNEDIDTIVTCNGLILISGASSFCLWNPATRYYKDVPYPCSSKVRPLLYGFGYDASIDDYKVLYADQNRASAYVLTLETNSWRRIGILPFDDIRSSSDHCELHGILHWRTNLGVACFHLRKEIFGVLRLPGYVKRSLCSVVVLGNHLCIAYQTKELEFVVYMWEEYGVSESWRELLTIFNFNVGSEPIRIVKPILFTKEGHMMMLIERGKGELVIYDKNDINGGEFEETKKFLVGKGVASYVESVASIPGGMPVLVEEGLLQRMGKVMKLCLPRVLIPLLLIFAFVLAFCWAGGAFIFTEQDAHALVPT